MIGNKTCDCAMTMHFSAALPDCPCSFGPASVVRRVGVGVACVRVTEADSGLMFRQCKGLLIL